MVRLRTLAKEWRSTTPTHRLGWALVTWQATQAAIFSAPLNGGVLMIAGMLLATERRNRVRRRRNTTTDGTGSTDGS